MLDGVGGLNWSVDGAGNDVFLARVDGDAGAAATWDTILDFHAGDAVTVFGYQEGVSTWGWSDAALGAADYQGATLTGSLNATGPNFAVTLAGVSVEQGRGMTTIPDVGDGGQGYLRLHA